MNRLLPLLPLLLPAILPLPAWAAGGGGHGGGGAQAETPTSPNLSLGKPVMVTVNFEGEGTHLVQLTGVITAIDPATAAAIKPYLMPIRHELGMLLTDKQYDDLMTDAGRKRLQEEALQAIRRVLVKRFGNVELVEGFYIDHLWVHY